MNLEFDGELFEERFLIADIEMEAEFPSERWFWFEPTFHPGQSALLHKQPDNIYRIDLQLGWDADPNVEKKPENVVPRIKKVVGDRHFKLDWVSVYTFQCRRLARFVHGRVIFVGDSAHVVSPFGARGGNGGVQDVDNLGWKLAAVLDGADYDLLESYNRERTEAADENIRHSARATRFMSPEEGAERLFRDQVLALAGEADFARGWVNSGRLSTPCAYRISAPDEVTLPDVSRPGRVAPDAPLGNDWLLSGLGNGFTVLTIGTEFSNNVADFIGHDQDKARIQRGAFLVSQSLVFFQQSRIKRVMFCQTFLPHRTCHCATPPQTSCNAFSTAPISGRIHRAAMC